MPNQQTKLRSYSILAMLLMVGIPTLLYIATAVLSVKMRESLQQGDVQNIADLATGGGLFMMRIGSIVLGVLGAFVAIFGSPKESMPKWMVRK